MRYFLIALLFIQFNYAFSQSVTDTTMVFIPGGTFRMGSTEQDYDQPIHTVTLSSFYLSKYEITVALFNDFIVATDYVTEGELHGDSSWVYMNKWIKMQGVDWRSNAEGTKYSNLNENQFPVVHVSWNDAVAYCNWLSKTKHNQYHLPTEAEWEFAAGNGIKHTVFSWGNDWPDSNQLVDNLRDEGSGWNNGFPHYYDGYKFLAPVGTGKPNDFGLYNMNGNVFEWCNDLYADYLPEAQTNPQGPQSGTNRAVRGGSFSSQPKSTGIADHNDSSPNEGRGSIGFRIAINNANLAGQSAAPRIDQIVN
jgi:sulfatase modifying factor 1